MRAIPVLAVAAATLVALGISGVPATAASPEVEITEWPVPWQHTRPRDPWVGGPQRIWFVGQGGDYVGMLDPETGEFDRVDLEPGAGPHTVIADDRGAWYAGNRADHIGRIDPETLEIERFELPGQATRDPHTMDFTSDGDIWFSVQRGNQIGFLDTATGDISLHDVATPGARPYGLLVDADDRPWATLFGTNKLATVTEDGEIEEIDLPRDEARPRRLALPADGSVWYVDYAGGHIGRLDPETGDIDEWLTPAGAESRPYAMASDDRGRLWFVETGVFPNRFVGFDPATETFTEPVELESGGGTVRHMVFDSDSGAIWFGTDTDTIGRAVLN